MKFQLILTLFLFHYISFSQTSVNETKSKLIGKWDWVKTQVVSRGGGQTDTPETCDCSKYIIFENNNTIKEYKNKILVGISPYSINEYNSQNAPTQIIIHSHILTGQIKMDGETMGVEPFGGCGSIEYFTKVNAPE